jgi:integrase
MASLIRQPRTRYWTAAFRDSTGRQVRQTTRETDKRKAQKVADILERTAKKQGNAQTVRQAFVDFYRDAYGEDLPSSNVREYAASWLAGRKAETTNSSYARYEKIVEKFLHFLGKDAGRDLSDIKRPHIVRFRDAEAKKFATATANLELKTIRMMFRQARIDQYIIVDPAEGVKVLKDRDHDKVKRRPFTVDELRRILANADDEWRSMTKFGLYTGQRLGDLAALRWTQIDLERDEIYFTTRKTGKRLPAPIAAPLHEHLEKIANNDDARAPVHPRAFEIVREQGGRVNTLSNQFIEILVATGLRSDRNHQSRGIGRDGKREGMDVSFHSLRHTAVSLLKDAGIPDSVVMALVGHDSVTMSQHYTHVGKESLANAAAKLPVL